MLPSSDLDGGARVVRSWRGAAVCALAAVLFAGACAPQERVADRPTPTPVGTPSSLPTPGDALASETVGWTERVEVRWSVYDLYRHGRYATLEFGATNLGTERLVLGRRLSRDGDREDVSGVTLRDSAGNRRYSPASYDGECYCSFGAYPVAGGQTVFLSATFAAPPAERGAVDVSVPDVGTFDDVPVRAAPRSRAVAASPPGLPDAVASRPTQLATSTENRLSPSDTYLVTSVYGVYRRGDQAVAMLGLSLQGRVPYGTVLSVSEMYASREGYGASDGVTLVEPSDRRAYRVSRDGEGDCLCPGTPQVGAYSTTVLYLGFAAPPADVREVDVSVPHAGVFAGVPVRSGRPPKPDAPAPLPHATYPNVVVPSVGASDEAADAPVVRVDTPVYTSG